MNGSTCTAPPGAALPGAVPRSGTLTLATLAVGFIMAMIDLTAVNTALADIARDLSVPLSGLVWVVDGYTLTFAALLLAGGALGDRIGARKAYIHGLGAFLFASVLCAVAPGGATLTAARLLQGAGAALFLPSSLSLLTHTFEDDRVRARMVGTWSAMVGASSAVGPLVGGILVHEFGWRSVFWVNVPLGLLGMALAWKVIVDAPPQPRPLSLASHGLGVLALAGLSFVLIEGPVLGWGSAAVLGAAAATAVVAATLIARERRAAHPMLPRALFATGSFAAANGTGFLINLAVFGQLFLLSLYLQARGADARRTGLALMPMMMAFTAGNFSSGRISGRFGLRLPLLAGLSVGAAMALVLVALSWTMPRAPFGVLLGVIVLMNIAIGVAIPAMTATVMQVAGKAYANSGAAALNANRQIGALVGVALMGSIMHALPAWEARLPLAFGVAAVCFAGAWLLVHRHVKFELT
ncbi:MFS transporter [Pseudoduganella namucuonensis]|uniref:MFS transporter, DHA2 family, methylenomycin A resistance protein n=1 Tax=Pseudoduganella namucuonensis TaxID=1035707 RepID=A0A1I7JKX9_9BURK|nr:MFS transporter [Pseudoduganella namucuonensis]SFU85781.1 MFS transporter, DHA2 family, methylenomycin A resistance protein [Pseudoduganella namucuonensis]